jgi:hypothetical protein
MPGGKAKCGATLSILGLELRCNCVVSSTQAAHRLTRWCGAEGNTSAGGKHVLYYPKTFLRMLKEKGITPDESAVRAVLAWVLWLKIRTLPKAMQQADTWLSQLSVLAEQRGVPSEPLPGVNLEFLDILRSTTSGNDTTKNACPLKTEVRAA